MTTTTAVEDRIAALRDEYARHGEDVTSLSDTELLYRELDRARTESRRHENNYSSLLQDQVKHDRSIYAAAHREAAEERMAWAGMYLNHLVRQSASHINEVINRAATMPDGRVPIEQTRELKAAAARAKWMMSGLVGHRESQFDEARRQDAAISLTEKQRAEILRLRGFITAAGQRLHTPDGPKVNGRCECSGCELIRAMDDSADIEQAA